MKVTKITSFILSYSRFISCVPTPHQQGAIATKNVATSDRKYKRRS